MNDYQSLLNTEGPDVTYNQRSTLKHKYLVTVELLCIEEFDIFGVSTYTQPAPSSSDTYFLHFQELPLKTTREMGMGYKSLAFEDKNIAC